MDALRIKNTLTIGRLVFQRLWLFNTKVLVWLHGMSQTSLWAWTMGKYWWIHNPLCFFIFMVSSKGEGGYMTRI
jgi:hypothetical protein